MRLSLYLGAITAGNMIIWFLFQGVILVEIGPGTQTDAFFLKATSKILSSVRLILRLLGVKPLPARLSGIVKVAMARMVFAALVCFGFLVCADAAQAVDPLTITVTGKSAVNVLTYTTDACSPEDVPDAPVRAYRDASGNVHVFATHYISRQMVGRSLTRLRRKCDVVFQAGDEPTPVNFNNREWLASFFTRDGRNVLALVHNEYHGMFWPGQCSSTQYTDCWYNSIRFATSSDSGAHFQQAPVLAVPYGPYSTTQVGARGFFQPANIVRSPADGYYYALLFAGDPSLNLCCSCLIRAADPFRFADWRAWDGAGFSLQLPNVYQQQLSTGTLCTPVNSMVIHSVIRHEPSSVYIGVFAVAATGGRGVFYTLSRDLIHWTDPKLFYAAAATCPNRIEITYPSILDPASKSMIFDTVGNTAQLFFTLTHLQNCQETLDRDLLRITVAITQNR